MSKQCCSRLLKYSFLCRQASSIKVIALPATWENAPMTIPTDAFRRFQAELADLDTKSRPSNSPMELAKEEFLALRKRYGLTVADVVTFFPEEEGIVYLQQLIAGRTR